jgi:hypothetical protein
MAIKKSKAQLKAKLEKENLVFHEFSLVHEGQYAVDDADWNYKDIPHLHYVHELAEAYPSYVSDDTIASIIIQKIPGIKIPLAVFLYENTPTSQLYYTASFFYVLLIETVYEKIEPNKTRVITTYSIGASRLLKWTFKLLEWLIHRNYNNLMSTDIPMRTRRGQLREWGYKFHKVNHTYSYEKSLNLVNSNVIVPQFAEEINQSTININDILPSDGEFLLGKDDAWGLRLVRMANNLKIYPRMCHHEGASLDGQKCNDNKIKCPWHGVLVRSIANFDFMEPTSQIYESKYHQFEYFNGLIDISFKKNIEDSRQLNQVTCEGAINGD